MKNGYHLSLGISRELWSDLLGIALPVDIAKGEFDLAANVRAAVKQLQVRERVAGLLEDRQPDDVLVRARDRARQVWHGRREGVYRRLNELVRVEGTWQVQLDDLGTQFRYANQQVGADAFVKGVATGKLILLRENVELPFTIEKRVGVTVNLSEIQYDDGRRAIIGSLRDLGVHVGDHAVMQLLGRLGEYLLEQQLPRVNPVPILRRDQVEEMVGPMGGPLKMKMGVQDLELEITEDDMTLKVRFGFTQLQLTDQASEDPASEVVEGRQGRR
jgi:hypothetical protein